MSSPPSRSKDWRYYENAIVHGQKLTAALLKEYKEGGSWKEHYKTWRDACVPLGKSKRQIDRLIQEEDESRTECPTEPLSETAKTLATVNDLPDPFDLMPPTVHAGAAAMPAQSTPKPKAVQEEVEHKPRMQNNNGKPVYALPVWRETLDFIGRAINRNDAINHLVPSPKDHDFIEGHLKDAFHRVEALHEKAKKL